MTSSWAAIQLWVLSLFVKQKCKQLSYVETSKGGMTSSWAAIQLKNQELQRRLEDVERKTGSSSTSSTYVAIQLKNHELEQRLTEVERKAGSIDMSSPCVAIELKNQEFEWRLEGVERKAGSIDMSSPCAAIQLKSQELQRRLEEMERKVDLTGTNFSCVAIQQKNQELERRLEDMAQLKTVLDQHERKLAEMKGGMSCAPAEVLLRIHPENHELQWKLAEWEKGSSRVISSASGEMSQISEELELKVAEMWKAAGTLQTERLEKLITASQELDLAFLVDATGSMGEVLESIKDEAGKIAAEVKKEWPELKLWVAFAPYRDYPDTDMDNGQTQDFTDDFEGDDNTFVKALSDLQAGGGKGPLDVAEDVFTGLERVAQRLSWTSRTRVLVHIADAPCHGTQFHTMDVTKNNQSHDHYPKGDKHGRSISALLKALREDRKINRYLFCHLKESEEYTKKMIREFKKECGEKEWIQEETLEEKLRNFLDVVVKFTANTISQSMHVGSGLAVGNFDNLDVEEQSFSAEMCETIQCEQATQITYKFPDSLEDLFDALATNGKLKMKELPELMIQIRPKPFLAEESVSWPYNALLYQPTRAPRHMVVKQFKIPQGRYEKEIHAKEAYFEQMEVQTVAAKMAEEFNNELESVDIGDRVQFTLVSTLRVGTKFFNMQKAVTGNWVTYYENGLNSANTKECTPILHAFSHWTYHRSKGLLVINDFQGRESMSTAEANVVWLCGPSLHCKDPLRYQTTKKNWGEPGMKRFLATHKCNAICQKLNLPPS